MVTLKTSNGYLSVETTESGEVISATHSVRLISMIWCYDLIRKNLGACPNTKRDNNVVPFKKTAILRRT